mgnify:FL=1
MDNISEQLVKIRKTTKDTIFTVGIWALAFLLVYCLVSVGLNLPNLFAFAILFALGVIYGAFKLTKLLDIEYEYIVVNRDMDIDKITAKSSRKRIVSVKLTEVQEFGLLTESKIKAFEHKNFDERFLCCNANDEIYYMIYKHPKKGLVLIMLAMNERTKTEALKSIPKIAQIG